MGINKTLTSMKKTLQMKNISSVIAVILGFSIFFMALSLVIAGVDYVQGFLANTGTANVGMVEIKYSSLSEKIQSICLCTLYLVSIALNTWVGMILCTLFNQIATKNKPFLPNQGKQLQKISILMLINALVCALCNPWAFALSAQPMPLIGLIGTFLLSLGSGLIFPLVFLCLAVIFNHGMSLQTESDETL